MAATFDYVKNISMLTLKKKRQFYVLLGHNLTVSVRAICCDEKLSDEEKIVGMKAVNEIMHRLILRIRELYKISKVEEDSWTEEDFWSLIKHHCSENQGVIAGNVGWAINASFKYSVKN